MFWSAVLNTTAINTHWYSTGINHFSWLNSDVIPQNSHEMAAEMHTWNTVLFALSKGSSSFYVNTQRKRRFSFSPITVLNNVFTVLFHCFLQYCRHLHNSIFPKGIIVWPSQYKASFNKHHSIEIIYNVSEVFSLHFSQKSRQMGLWKVLIFASYVIHL